MPHITYRNDNAYLQGKPDRPVFLSGGFGETVNKTMKDKGVKKEDSLQKGSSFIAPLQVPNIVQQIHGLYAAAGADILTADTYCASVSRQKGDIALVKKFIGAAAGLAREASIQSGLNPLVALSLTASGDSHMPEDTPDSQTLIREHKQNIALLKGHGDLIIAETLPTLREGAVIADLLQNSKTPFFMSFTLNAQGQVLDGSEMSAVVKTILQPHTYCLGVGVNCCSVSGAQEAVSALGKIFAQSVTLSGKHIVAYPNGFAKSLEENNAAAEKGHTHGEAFTPAHLAGVLRDMLNRGATAIGGCCGSEPEHTNEYAQLRFSNVPAVS